MANRPLTAKQLLELVKLYYKESHGLRSSARKAGVSVPTAKKYIKELEGILNLSD